MNVARGRPILLGPTKVLCWLELSHSFQREQKEREIEEGERVYLVTQGKPCREAADIVVTTWRMNAATDSNTEL